MKINFSKYQGAGNDFVIVNKGIIPNLDYSVIKNICNRHFGIGADGFIVLCENLTADFEMVYYNADGNIGSMCGNGARCAAVFAFDQKIVSSNIMNFKSFDGAHTAKIFPDGAVKVSMNDVKTWKNSDNDIIIETGSPHYIKRVSGLKDLDVLFEGRKIRYNEHFKELGININFFEIVSNEINMRTYERGVENETLACGTGTVAVAISTRFNNDTPIPGKFEVDIKALGGDLKVTGEFSEGVFKNLYLIGPAKKVFEGSIDFA